MDLLSCIAAIDSLTLEDKQRLMTTLGEAIEEEKALRRDALRTKLTDKLRQVLNDIQWEGFTVDITLDCPDDVEYKIFPSDVIEIKLKG